MKHYPALVEGRMNVSELEMVCRISWTTVYKYVKNSEIEKARLLLVEGGRFA